MKRLACLLLIFCGFLIFNTSQGLADRVYMKSDQMRKGLVVEQHYDRIVLSTYRGEVIIPKYAIEEIFFEAQEQNYLYLGDRAFEEKDLDKAIGFYYKANQMNPELKQAQYAIMKAMDEQKRLKLKLSSSEASTMLYEQLGIKLKKTDNIQKITSVREDSPADFEGIKKGDSIVKAWDSSLYYMEPDEAAWFLMGEPNTAVVATIQKNLTLPVIKKPWYARLMTALKSGRTKRLGMVLSMQPEGLTISEVVRATPASEIWFKEGDLICQINGKTTRYMPLAHAANLIFRSKSDKIGVIIRREVALLRKGN